MSKKKVTGSDSFPLINANNQNISPLDKKLQLISSELDIIKPDTLLLNVDPSIDAIEIIEQIKTYYGMIHREMVTLKSQDNQEKELIRKIKDKQQELDNLVNLNTVKKRSLSSSQDRKKPTVDYRTKIRILEKELNVTYQNYNNTRGKNEQLKAQLNELRKKTLVHTENVKEISRKLHEDESEYLEKREEVEKKLKQREDKQLVNRINTGQQKIRENNDKLIEQIKSSDKDMNKKLALRKYLENEKNKLEAMEKNIDLKWENERKKFYEHYSEQIKHLQTFDPSSKLLELLDEDKIKKLEDILNQMLEATNLTNIDALIDYFIKCTKEFKNFEDFIGDIHVKVSELEKEVQELEYIINFCERNLQVREDTIGNVDKNLDEQEIQVMNDLKKAGENFIHLQYHTIMSVYKKYCEEVYNLIKKIEQSKHEESNYFENKTDSSPKNESTSADSEKGSDKEDQFLKFLKEKLQSIQDRLKDAHSFIRDKRSISTILPANKNSNPKMTIIGELDFCEVDHRFGQKSEKIKDSVRKEFDRSNNDKGSRMINLTKMKGILDPLINEENK
jgi:DNA repair exonuclease SbcCD ATPase subunit